MAKTKREVPSTNEIQARVRSQISQASRISGSDVAEANADLMDRYLCEPYGDEKEGYSSVVMSDVSDTIEWIMPQLMEMFLADRPIKFRPIGEDDEEAAEQETDSVNHMVLDQNPGFLIFYSWFKDALLQKNGIVKSWWDESVEVTTEEYENISVLEIFAMQNEILSGGGEFEVLAQSSVMAEQQDQFGNIASVDTGNFNIKVKITNRSGIEVVEPVPPEEFLISPRHNSIMLDKVPFCAHRRERTVSDLMDEGYDYDQLCTLSSPSKMLSRAPEAISRFSQEGTAEDSATSPVDKSMEEVLVHECYLYIDIDGDGYSELVKIVTGGEGNEILLKDGEEDIEEVDGNPFSALTPILMAHRFYGRSIAELVTDLQRIHTVLFRQTLDNMYRTNNVNYEISDDGVNDNTIDDLLTGGTRPGGIVRTATPGNLREITVPSILGNVLPLVQRIDELRENRSGVTKYTQGIDADHLNKTAAGIGMIMTAGQAKIALIARTLAETGVKQLYQKVHKDILQHSTKPLAINRKGKWEQVDPRNWKTRKDMVCSIGVGNVQKNQQLVHLNALLERQIQALQNPQYKLVSPKQVYNTLEEIVKNSNLRSVERFFTDPANPTPEVEALAQPRPDPAMEAAKMEFELRNRELALKENEAKAKADMAAKEHELEVYRLALEEKGFDRDTLIKSRELSMSISRAAVQDALAERTAGFDRDRSISEALLKMKTLTNKENVNEQPGNGSFSGGASPAAPV